MSVWADFLDFLLGLAAGVVIMSWLELFLHYAWLRKRRL